MEELFGRNTKMIMRKNQVDLNNMSALGKGNVEYLQKQQMIGQSNEGTINEVFECLRDASSTENIRAIQDSESRVAQDMKKMVKTLVKKGWSKNEVIYEMQRIFGNDILILKGKLDDERGFVGKYGIPILGFSLFSGFMIMRRQKFIRLQRAAFQAAELQAEQARLQEEADKIDKDELMRKLNMKK